MPILQALDERKDNIKVALRSLQKWAANEKVDPYERHFYNTAFNRLWDRWMAHEARDYYLAHQSKAVPSTPLELAS